MLGTFLNTTDTCAKKASAIGTRASVQFREVSNFMKKSRKMPATLAFYGFLTIILDG